MFNLSRREFPDRLLNQEDLDDVTDLWLAWHGRARTAALSLRRLLSYHAVRLKLWGFPRSDGPALGRHLQARLADGKVTATVSLEDPDYVCASGPFRELPSPCSLGEWLALVDDPLYDGLVLFLELSVHDWPELPEGPAAAGGTLVLCGELRNGALLLKAAWPYGLEPGVEELYKLTVWPDEAAFLHALDVFRRGGVEPPPRNYFELRRTQRQAHWLARTLIHLPGKGSRKEGRLQSVLARVIGHAVFLTAFATLALYLPIANKLRAGLLLACLPIVTFSLGALLYVVWSEAKRVCSLYRRMTAGLKRVYTVDHQYQPVDMADYGLNLDANARKYTRELEILGCKHLGDVRMEPGPTGTWVNRIFVLPNERIYVYLNLMTSTENFQKFPAFANFLIITYLNEGRVVTIGEGGGFRKSLLPKIFCRRFPDMQDPATLIAKHRKLLAEVCAQGHALAPPVDLHGFLERSRRDHEEVRPLMEKYGYYSWPAAFRQSFGLVRKEFLEPAEPTKRS